MCMILHTSYVKRKVQPNKMKMKMIEVCIEQYMHSWLGLKHAYLHQSLYYAIFKFVNTYNIWSNHYISLIIFLLSIKDYIIFYKKIYWDIGGN